MTMVHPLSAVKYIGPALQRRLMEHGIETVGQLAALPMDELLAIPGIGSAMAPLIQAGARELLASTESETEAGLPVEAEPVPVPVSVPEEAGEPDAEPAGDTEPAVDVLAGDGLADTAPELEIIEEVGDREGIEEVAEADWNGAEDADTAEVAAGAAPVTEVPVEEKLSKKEKKRAKKARKKEKKKAKKARKKAKKQMKKEARALRKAEKQAKQQARD